MAHLIGVMGVDFHHYATKAVHENYRRNTLIKLAL